MRGRDLGPHGERVAAEFLRRQGYDVLEANARGRAGEIDLVARDRDEWVFVEVKTRVVGGRVPPEEALTSVKLDHIERNAAAYLTTRGLQEAPWRIEVVAIDVDPQGDVRDVRLIRDLG